MRGFHVQWTAFVWLFAQTQVPTTDFRMGVGTESSPVVGKVWRCESLGCETEAKPPQCISCAVRGTVAKSKSQSVGTVIVSSP